MFLQQKLGTQVGLRELRGVFWAQSISQLFFSSRVCPYSSRKVCRARRKAILPAKSAEDEGLSERL